MSVEFADKNFERKRDETKTMVDLENPKTPKTLGFPGRCEGPTCHHHPTIIRLWLIYFSY